MVSESPKVLIRGCLKSPDSVIFHRLSFPIPASKQLGRTLVRAVSLDLPGLFKHPLSPKELKTIRTLLRSNEVPVQDIAAQFKVNRSTLYRNVTAVP